MAASSVRIAGTQMTSINDLASNFATCSCLTKETAPTRAKLICFPENFAFVGAKDGDSLSVAEPLDGPIMQQYCSLVRETCIWLSLGGFQEKGLDDKHLCNTHVVIDDAGKIKNTYKKIHFHDLCFNCYTIYIFSFSELVVINERISVCRNNLFGTIIFIPICFYLDTRYQNLYDHKELLKLSVSRQYYRWGSLELENIALATNYQVQEVEDSLLRNPSSARGPLRTNTFNTIHNKQLDSTKGFFL
ncbi:hypothetical protein UlMin_022511 [Ulmus minor]